MRKTAKEIEIDVFHIFNEEMTGFIGGKVYRKGNRPKDAKTEDAVVAFSEGYEAQAQTGEVYLHVYVPYRNGVHNSPRIGEIEKKIIQVRDGSLAANAEYLFDMRKTPNDIELDDIEQSLISAIIKYKRYTF